MKWKIGCDPELFLLDPITLKHIPALGIVPGDKHNPHPVKKGTVQVDGLAAEIGIDPASSPEEFADNVETVLEELKKFTGNLLFDYTPSVLFDREIFEMASPESKVLGCDPDFNAYTQLANPTPVPNPENLRTASGHVHIGWDSNIDVTELSHFQDCCEVAKQMDFCLGIPSLMCEDKDAAIRRRNLYGKAGAFRVKSYGCEYRTLSNFWLGSRELMLGVYNNTVYGMDKLYTGTRWNDNHTQHAKEIIDKHSVANVVAYCEALHVPYLVENKKGSKVSNG